MRLRFAALAATPLLAAALAACAATSVTTTRTPSDTPHSATATTTRTPASDDAARALARYADDLPAGYTWPAAASAGDAEMLWACLHLDAAWAAIDADDAAEAERLTARVYDATTLWDSDPPLFTTGPYARDWGWHGICTQQLGMLEYPVRGLYEWRPSSPATGASARPPAHETNCRADGYAVDAGPAPSANGTVESDAEGRPVAYIVAAGDAPSAIQDRLCITNLMERNGLSRDIQPGERLSIDPVDALP